MVDTSILTIAKNRILELALLPAKQPMEWEEVLEAVTDYPSAFGRGDEELAERSLENLGLFRCVRLVQEIELKECGELITELEPLAVANKIIDLIVTYVLSRAYYRHYRGDAMFQSVWLVEFIGEINDFVNKIGVRDMFLRLCERNNV